MPLKRHETVDLTEKDLKDAVMEFLNRKYGQPDGATNWNINLKHSVSTSGQGWAKVDFSAHAARELKSPRDS